MRRCLWSWVTAHFEPFLSLAPKCRQFPLKLKLSRVLGSSGRTLYFGSLQLVSARIAISFMCKEVPKYSEMGNNNNNNNKFYNFLGKDRLTIRLPTINRKDSFICWKSYGNPPTLLLIDNAQNWSIEIFRSWMTCSISDRVERPLLVYTSSLNINCFSERSYDILVICDA